MTRSLREKERKFGEKAFVSIVRVQRARMVVRFRSQW